MEPMGCCSLASTKQELEPVYCMKSQVGYTKSEMLLNHQVEKSNR